jgi:hypothetical protein
MGLLTPVEQQTKDVFGMVPIEERLSLLPRYSKTAGLVAPQFVYELAKAVSTPIVAARGGQVSPEEALNVPLSGFAGSSIGTAPKGALRSGLFKEGKFDPRFDPRKLEQERLRALTTVVDPTSNINIPIVNLSQYEGRPFITSMSDRTAAGGNLTKINDVQLNRPVGLLGGQDYMFNNTGQVWASAQNPVKAILENAKVIKGVTGQDPLYIPWRMAPTGGDFAHMTGETMLSYAESALSKTEKAKVNKEIKQFIPDWKGLGSDQSIDQFRNASDKVRKALKNALDTNFRNTGGLSIGEARLAVADPKQLIAPDAGIMNVGEIFTSRPMIQQSGHPSYPRGVPGQGLGRLEKQHNIFELLPQVAQARGLQNPTAPRQTDIRALQMKPYAGVITADLLKSLGY